MKKEELGFFRSGLVITLSFCFASLGVGSSGCSSAAKKADEIESTPVAAPIADDASLNASGDSDSGRAAGLETIHFAYDSSRLDSEAESILTANAEILKSHTSLKVQLEGHCDQRGSVQYNIALGERRANSVKAILHELGIASDRISVISYGKERPVDSAESEGAYAKNRRVNFAITSK